MTAACLLDRSGLDPLIQQLLAAGYRVIAPQLRDGAIVFAETESADQLPVGWTALQGAGEYRVQRRDDEAVFGYAVGPHSAKQELQPPRQTIFWLRKQGDEMRIVEPEPAKPVAVLGLRACDLAAIAIQDRVFLQGPYVDRPYEIRREQSLLIAVNCNQPAATCFCVSMDGGPQAREGYDLNLTELLDTDRHDFLLEAGSERGEHLLAQLPVRDADEADLAQRDALMETATGHMGRTLDAAQVPQLLRDNFEHPRWDRVAERCLACGNCTMVCPTCFCHSTRDASDLAGAGAERVREWDSCFSQDFSYVHGGAVRDSIRSRYRQWLSHKLSSWVEQFGRSGCVGCGRCISWCPVGIDLTEEVAAMRKGPGNTEETKS